MRVGAVAMIDCLGFKGIWTRADPELVLENMRRIKASGEASLHDGIFKVFQGFGARTQVSFLSDTAVIGVDAASVTDDSARGALMIFAALIAKRLAHDLLVGTPALTVRGCICYGEFEIADNFIIGPAVDEAASLHEAANGAFVWIPPHYDCLIAAASKQTSDMLETIASQLPAEEVISKVLHTYVSAEYAARVEKHLVEMPMELRLIFRTIVRDALRRSCADMQFVRYNVPMKKGDFVDAFVLSPFLLGGPPTFKDICERHSSSMTSELPGVDSKRENTMRFLAYAMSIVEERANQYDEAMNSPAVAALHDYLNRIGRP